MKRVIGLACGALLALPGLAAHAQQTQADQSQSTAAQPQASQTIEELYLNNSGTRLIGQEAKGADRTGEQLAFDSIKDLLDSGKPDTGTIQSITSILSYLALEGTEHEVWENARIINNFPDIRYQACDLLGRVGGERSTEALLKVLQSEHEPEVLASAVYSLGLIGIDDANEASEAIAATVVRQNAVAPDNNFAFAALLAFEHLAKKNNGLKDTNAFNAVVLLSEGTYIKAVQTKAGEVLDLLKSYT